MLDIPADRILRKGRLQPGKLFLVDLEQGRIVPDDGGEGRGRRAPAVRRVVRPRARSPRRPARAPARAAPPASRVRRLQLAFGYTQEDMKVMLAPLAINGEEAIGSMGNDTPLAVLSDRRPLLYSYFKQLFAQVTNPPIDPIREAVVMSVAVARRLGAQPARRDTRARAPARDRQPDPARRGARAARGRSTPTSSRRTRSTSPGRSPRAPTASSPRSSASAPRRTPRSPTARTS